MAQGSGRRMTGVAAASWLVATVMTSFVVWQAVAVFTDGEATDMLSEPQVSARLGGATTTTRVPAASPSPVSLPPSSRTRSSTPDGSLTPSAVATSTEPDTTSAPAPVVRTWTVTGGSLSVSCEGQAIALVYAKPQDGWRVETERRAVESVDISFERVGQGTEVKAACVGGVPQQTTAATQGDR